MRNYPLDYFVGALACLNCQKTSKADESTDMQTKICAERTLRNYGVGDVIRADYEKVEQNGYILLNKPASIKSYKLAELWTCPYCNSINLALIEIEDEVIYSIQTIGKEENISSLANYASEDMRSLLDGA